MAIDTSIDKERGMLPKKESPQTTSASDRNGKDRKQVSSISIDTSIDKERGMLPKSVETIGDIYTASGQKVTTVLPNVGWVGTETGEKVYDIEAYSQLMGHSPGYYVGGESPEAEAIAKERGFEVYGGTHGAEPQLPEDWEAKTAAERFKFAEQQGLIPKGSMHVGEGQYLSRQTLQKIQSQSPELHNVLVTKGYEAYQTAYGKAVEDQRQRLQQFEDKLRAESPDLYEASKQGGLDAYNAVVKVLNAEYAEFQQKVASGEIVVLPDGKYIKQEELDKQAEGVQNILKLGGFAALEKLGTVSVEEANEAMRGANVFGVTSQDIVTAMELSGVQFPERLESWMSLPEVGYVPPSLNEAKDVWFSLSDEEKANVLSKYRDSTRDLIGVATFIAPATKALLPEYTTKDISGVEWGLTAVNTALLATAFAPGALLGSVAGKAATTGLSVGGAGLVGYQTTRQWGKLSVPEKAMGVAGVLLYALPVLALPIRGIKVTSVKIPTAEGEATAWKGLSLFNNPIIGRSEGKWIVGSRNITIPEAKFILDGYKPEVMLDTKVFVNEEALRKAGFSQTQIDYLNLTLKDRNLFAGSKSPYLSEEVLFEPTARLDTDEITVFLKQIDKYRNNVDHVDLLYGSQTMKAQLAPELRAWRYTHDLDMHSTFSLDEAIAWTQETIGELNKLRGGRQYRVSPESPIRIEKLVDGKWEHINDLKSGKIDPKLQGGDIPGSKLDATGAYSYGRLVEEPAITIEYPDIGKVEIQRLSMTGVQKADTILRVRQTEMGTAFRPPERGIASPGVPKDAADFYVILRTFKGQELADDWAKAWARAMGYGEEEARRWLPRLTKAMQDVVAETPSDLIGYRFYPKKGRVISTEASPTITVHIPKSLSDSVSGELRSAIMSPISPYAVASSIPSGYLPSISDVSKYSLVTPTSAALTSRPSVGVSSVGMSPLVSPSPTMSPSPSVSPSPPVSPLSSMVPSPSISPMPSPSPVGEPPFETVTPPSKPPIPIRDAKAYQEQVAKIKPGTLVWIQGRPIGGAMYKVLPPPYTEEVKFTMREPPPGYTDYGHKGKGSAFKSIQVVGGNPPESVENIDLGIMRINVNLEGGIPVISYTPDEEANVGVRGQTIGMGEGQIPIEEWKQAKEEGLTKEDIVGSSGEERVEGGRVTDVESAPAGMTLVGESAEGMATAPALTVEAPPTSEPTPETPETISTSERMQTEVINAPPQGTIIWKDKTEDGATYRVAVPPYGAENMFATEEAVSGYADIGTVEGGESYRTLQVVGGVLPNPNEVIDVGMATVRMVNGDMVVTRKDPAEYERGHWVKRQTQVVETRDGARYVYRENEFTPAGISKMQKEQSVSAYESVLPEGDGGEERTRRRKVEEGEGESGELVGASFASDGEPSKVAQMLDVFAGVESPKARYEPLAGSNILEGEFGEEQPELPYTVVPSYIRRKKPKNLRDWWESDYYGSETIPSARRSKSVDNTSVTERTYLGHRVLPPELGGAL